MEQNNIPDTTFWVFWAVEGCISYKCITLPERDVYNKIVKEILIPSYIPMWISRGRILASGPGTLETLEAEILWASTFP